MIGIIIAIAVLVLAGIIICVLYHFGMLSFYHPMKKAKDNCIRVACVGDSITYGLMVKNWSKHNYPYVLNKLLGENYCVNNFAYTNRTAIKSGDFPLVNEKVYKQSLEFKPNIVIILLGTNDSKANNWDKDKFINDYGEIIDSYLRLDSSPKVYILTPPPLFEVRGKVLYKLRKPIVESEIIPAIENLVKAKGVDHIDVYKIFEGKKELFSDGVHPNVEGSKLLAQSVFEKLKDN
ncbi:MAG: hypothetical protein K2G37_02540 [Clostridia bacterium]|nr:hypothetical protein [Clostridia bacterium]MDE7329191.1 hypothetical protein [Clostridia bacterium]